MTVHDIKIIGIAGAGTMGQGIAQICALAGFKTILFDIKSEMLEVAQNNISNNLVKGVEKGKLTDNERETSFSLISYTENIKDLVCDLVIEAVLEKLEIKQQLLSTLEKINSENTILATNTSSIPVTQIARTIQKPNRVVGMHFFNPAHIMKLVEVIDGVNTDRKVTKTIYDLALKLGKTPVLAKDSPGFIVNRVARHYYVESLKIAEENVVDIESIDKLLESSGFKMGPFKLMDLIGIDTNFSVTSSMFESFKFDSKFRPSRIQEQKVMAGHNGMKSGKGFYDYTS